MKALAALALLLLAACSSSDGFDRDLVLECGGDSLIDVRVGLNPPAVQMEGQEDRLMMFVEVSNNSSEEIIVRSIRIEQMHTNTADYGLDNGYRSFKQAIAEAEDHTFEIPMTGRWKRAINDPRAPDSTLHVVASVTLEDGRSVRCPFEVRGPR